MKQHKEAQWKGKSRGGAFGHQFFVALIRLLGIRAAYFFLSFVVVYFIPFAWKATKVIWRYNREILKYSLFKSAYKIYAHYYVFGQTLIDKIAINNGLAHKYKFEFENYEEFLRILDGGGAVIIGAHVGSWEIGSQFFGDYADKLNIVMYDAEYQKIKDVLYAQGFPYSVIPVNDGAIESLLKIKHTLDQKHHVCFQGDRYVDSSSTIKCNFMGKDALFPIGPTLIASKFKTPTIFYFSMREKGMKYRFHFHLVEGEMKQRELLDRYIAELEVIVKKYPQQWFNFYNLWHIE